MPHISTAKELLDIDDKELIELTSIGDFKVYKMFTGDYMITWAGLRLFYVLKSELAQFIVALHYNPDDCVKTLIPGNLRAIDLLGNEYRITFRYPHYKLLTYRGENYSSLVSPEEGTMMLYENGQELVELTLRQAKEFLKFFKGVKCDSSTTGHIL